VQAGYKQLRERIQENLAADDVLRTDLVPRLEATLAIHAQAETALEDVRNTAQLSREGLENAPAGWGELIEKTYGARVSMLGQEQAEECFPPIARVSKPSK